MIRESSRLVRSICLVAVLITAGSLSPLLVAEEHIISYHSEIDIARDGSMEVTESIRVRAEGSNIRRGIYRDFPTDYRDRLGNHYIVDFDVLGTTRDGNAEPWRRERRGNGVRVYIGDENVILEPGEYSYLIRYRTDRQLGFFETHDELYWNVTGNGWAFSILSASATVNLPEDLLPAELTETAYTGQFGSNAQNYRASLSPGSAEFTTTQPLAPREGLTIVLGWPKGVVLEPTASQKLAYLLFDNRGLLLMLVALLLSMIYLYRCWTLAGRDPDAGIIFPHYEPPKGYSPASTRYITKMGYDKTAFSAAIINLAVKGHVTISKAADEYTLLKNSSEAKLAPGEAVLLEQLFVKDDVLFLDPKNLNTINKAKRAHKAALRKDYNNIYFNLNWALLLPSAIGSIAALILVAGLGALTPMVALLSALLVIIHIVFLYLMRAPSIKGRLLMDKLEGFKLYLTVAEQDDLNLKNPPDKTPELFESYLPFALALGVEQAWAEQFTEVFERLESSENRSYHPLWYSGSFHVHDMNSFATDIGQGFNSAISAATTAPGSSSGGGGFSGGGGGGGGGGGW